MLGTNHTLTSDGENNMAHAAKPIIAFDMPARYANALFQLAREQEQIEHVAQHMRQLAELIRDVPECRNLLNNQTIDMPERKYAMKNIMAKLNLSSLVQNFVSLVLTKGRAADLPRMLQAFDAQLDAYQNITHIQITSADKLNESQTQKLHQICKNHFGEKIEITFHVDPALLGGLKIALPDQPLDASLIGKLSQLEDGFQNYFQAI